MQVIKTITEFDGQACLIFDVDLETASGLVAGDVVDVEVSPDGTIFILPVTQEKA